MVVVVGETTLLVVPVTSPTPLSIARAVAPVTFQARVVEPPGEMVAGDAVNTRMTGRRGMPACWSPVKQPVPPRASARAATRPAGWCDRKTPIIPSSVAGPDAGRRRNSGEM